MKNGGKLMGEILIWLVVVLACGGIFFASFVTIIYLGQKLKEENTAEVAEPVSADEPEEIKAHEDEIVIADMEPSKEAVPVEQDEDEIDMSKVAEAIEEIESVVETPSENSEEPVSSNFALSDFDQSLINFLENAGYKNENYMVSPASLRAVIGLAVAGADSSTKDELLKAAGFKDEADMISWYEGMSKPPVTKGGDVTFKVLNSAWHNSNMKGSLLDDYKDYIKNHYNAQAEDVEAAEITEAVNNWVNEGTNGLIPALSDDLSSEDMVLVNTLYLKTSWIKKFEKEATEEDDFMSYDGCCIKKEFMDQTDKFRFYEDDETKILVMDMEGKIEVAFVLGKPFKFQEKLAKTAMERVHVKIPKIDTETSFDEQELVKYLQSRGAKNSFLPSADFSRMSSNSDFFVSDIIQKTKMVVDEDGIEAAAATSIAMLGSALSLNEDEPKEFVADEPFSYYVLTTGSSKEILFYGQIVE